MLEKVATRFVYMVGIMQVIDIVVMMSEHSKLREVVIKTERNEQHMSYDNKLREVVIKTERMSNTCHTTISYLK